MKLETLVDLCLSKKGTTQEFPFDNKTMVFKVFGKIFALCNIEKWQNDQASVNLKNVPEKNTELRENYASIVPGYHMNKKHWNTLHLWEEELDDASIVELLEESYHLVAQKVPQKKN